MNDSVVQKKHQEHRMNNDNRKPSAVIPAAGKRHGAHVWTPGSDVQSLWKKFGWTPPSEARPALQKGRTAANDVHSGLRALRG